MKVCNWCGSENVKFANSHIIPESFFNYDGKNNKVLIGANARGIRRPKGSYDSSILCLNCESDCSRIDSEAADILLNNFEKKLIPFNDERDELLYQIDGKYYQPLKRFLIYVLWRASVSKMPEFFRVNLGSYEEKIKHAIITNKIFNTDEYSFWAFHIEKPSATMLPYKLSKNDSGRCNYYSLDLANFTFQVKIDSQKTPKIFDDFAYHQNVPFLRFEKTPDGVRKAMAEVAKSHTENYPNLKSLKT